MSGGRTSASRLRSAATAAAAFLLTACASTVGPAVSNSPLPAGRGWKVEAVVPIGSSVGAPVVAGRLVWVANMAAGTISAVDIEQNRVVHSIRIGDPQTLVGMGCGASSVHSVPHGSFDIRRCDVPSAVAAVGSSLWVTQNDRRAVLRLDAVSGRLLAAVPVGIEAFGLAASSAGVWVTDFQHDAVVRIDPQTNTVVATITNLPNGPSGVAVGAEAIWVSCARAGVVARIDPVANRVAAQVPVGKSPLPVIEAFGSVWVRSEEADTLSRIEPATNQVVATVGVGPSEGRDGLDQFGVDSGGLWLSGLRISHLDAATNRVDRGLAFDAPALTYRAGTIWATGILGTLVRIRVS